MPPGGSQAVVLVTLWYLWYAAHLHYVELPNFISSGKTRQITVETFYFFIILFFVAVVIVVICCLFLLSVVVDVYLANKGFSQ